MRALWSLLCVMLLLLPVYGQANDTAASLQATITSIWDGDSLRAGKIRLRLHGLDAPEKDQICQDHRGHDYPCGQEALAYLQQLVPIGAAVRCAIKDVDRYGRLIAACRLASAPEKTSINAKMVDAGWALAYRRYSQDYIEEERAAKSAKRGLWAGQFMPPETYRAQK